MAAPYAKNSTTIKAGLTWDAASAVAMLKAIESNLDAQTDLVHFMQDWFLALEEIVIGERGAVDGRKAWEPKHEATKAIHGDGEPLHQSGALMESLRKKPVERGLSSSVEVDIVAPAYAAVLARGRGWHVAGSRAGRNQKPGWWPKTRMVRRNPAPLPSKKKVVDFSEQLLEHMLKHANQSDKVVEIP